MISLQTRGNAPAGAALCGRPTNDTPYPYMISSCLTGLQIRYLRGADDISVPAWGLRARQTHLQIASPHQQPPTQTSPPGFEILAGLFNLFNTQWGNCEGTDYKSAPAWGGLRSLPNTPNYKSAPAKGICPMLRFLILHTPHWHPIIVTDIKCHVNSGTVV